MPKQASDCPECGGENSLKVVQVSQDDLSGYTVRRRRCKECKIIIYTRQKHEEVISLDDVVYFKNYNPTNDKCYGVHMRLRRSSYA